MPPRRSMCSSSMPPRAPSCRRQGSIRAFRIEIIDHFRQLCNRSKVIADRSAHRARPPGLNEREKTMASRSDSRKFWIAGGVVAVIGVVGMITFDYPPGLMDTAGTIVPAKRFRADGGGSTI